MLAAIGPLGNGTASARDPAAAHVASSGSPTPLGTGPRLAQSNPGATTSRTRRARSAPASACPWLNQSLPIPERVEMLMSHMSLADKVAEMYIDEGAGTGPYAGYEGFVPAQPALCIPDLVEEDGPAGVAFGATGVTQLPAEVSLGSAWDASLADQYGVVNGQQHRQKGIAMTLGPGVNIQRDPRWGRNFEMFSEDPFLTSALGTADIEGIQSQHELADVKHFATYNQETYRNTPAYDTVVSNRTLHEIYLPPFYSAVEQADAASIMCSYPLLNGQYSCQDAGLLTGILNDRWGFPGFIRADSSANNSTVDSADAGLDQERGSFFWDNGLLIAAVEGGQVELSTVTRAVSRILTEMFQFDLFNDPPSGNLSTPTNTDADDGLALNVAERGTVLLQNTGHVLPLTTATTKSIAVIGADGTTAPQTSGGGSAKVRAPYVISPLTGLADRVGSAATVTSYSGTDPTQAAATARTAQVAIVFVSYPEAEGNDLANISLPNGQDTMIEAVAAANPNTIVVLNTGGPVLMPWLGQVKSVLEAWYPGQEDGAAIASVLFGDTDPSGHLTETFPSSLSAMPTAPPSRFPGLDGQVHYSEGLDVGYRWYDAHHVTPLFPFGYGLSYTTFRFSHLTVTPEPVVNKASGPETTVGQGATVAHVTTQITNTGSVSGSDVVQLYVGDPAAAGEPPRQLEGFRRVTLAPHTSRTVTFAITGHELSYFNTNANGWALPEGRFSIYVGDSSALASLPLHGRLTVAKTLGTRYATLAAPATVNPGGTFTATARFINHGSLPIKNGIVQLTFPSGWTVVRAAPKRTLSVPVGQTALRNFTVTAPEKAEGSVTNLVAHLSSAGVDGAGDLSATAAISVQRPITVTPLSTLTVASPGLSASATVVVASQMNRAVTVQLDPSLPSGVTIAPVSPSVSVRAHRTVSLHLLVSAAAGGPLGSDFVALRPSFVDRGKRYSLGTSVLSVDVPYPSLAAAFNTTAISDDSDITAGDFDGSGNSYSEQALTAAGLSPGATLTVGTTTLQWPDVPAGTPDSVLADGQTISLAGTPADTQLTVLGASSGANESGTGAIEYSDGTVQPYTLTLDNWFNLPSASNTAAATTTYVNDSTGAGDQGVVGQRNHNAYVFAVSIPLQSGKTVSSVTLPRVGLLPGVFPMHVFALGLGGSTT